MQKSNASPVIDSKKMDSIKQSLKTSLPNKDLNLPNANAMNNTVTTFSSNIIKGSQKSQKSNIGNLNQGAKTEKAPLTPQNVIDQKQEILKSSTNQYESDYESDEVEDDIQNRKAFNVDGDKSKPTSKIESGKVPINWEVDNPVAG